MLPLYLQRPLMHAHDRAPDPRRVGVGAVPQQLELPVRGPNSLEAEDAEIGHHGLPLAVGDCSHHLLLLGVGQLAEEDAVGRLLHTQAADTVGDVGDGVLYVVVGSAVGTIQIAA